MKAHIAKSDIVLSVGMIVKNEEKYIGGCLKALKPLLDAVPSEIVIVDTGSVDRTMEIASEYTDNVFSFEWIDDFSAARNFGLKKCTGEWFMFLDADEHLSDAAEMIEFFGNTKINSGYNSAYFQVRNFSTEDEKNYADFYVQRITRRTSNLAFINPIHEIFNSFPNPAYYFKTPVKHYGYVGGLGSKRERNLAPLLIEIKKKPDDLRIIWHLLDLYGYDSPEKKEYSERALKLIKNDNSEYGVALCFKVADYYSVNNDNAKMFAALNMIPGKVAKNNAVLLEMFALKAIAHYKKEQYADAESCFKKYFSYYEQYENNKLDMSLLQFVYIIYSESSKLAEMRRKYANCISKQNRANDAAGVFIVEDYAAMDFDEYKLIVDTLIGLTDGDEKLDNFAAICDKINLSCGSDKIVYLDTALETAYYDGVLTGRFKPSKGDFARFIAASESESDRTALETNLGSFDTLKKGLSGVLYLALKNNVDISRAILNTDMELVKTHISIIGKKRPDYSLFALNYLDNACFNKNAQLEAFGVTLFYNSLIDSDSLEDGEITALCERFLYCSSLLVDNIYNPDLLNDTDCDMLPFPHRLGYYALKQTMGKDELIRITKEKTGVLHYEKKPKKGLVDKDTAERATALAKEHHTDDAVALFENTDFANLDIHEFKETVDLIFHFTNYSLEYDKFTAVCDNIIAHCDSERVEYLNTKLEDKYYFGSLSRRFKPKGGDFAELLRVVESDAKTAERFLNRFNPLPIGLSEALYLALRHNIDVSEALKKMDYELMYRHVFTAVNDKIGAPEVAIKYQKDCINEFYFASIKTLGFGVMLFDSVLRYADNCPNAVRAQIYKILALFTSLYVKNVYREEFLKDNGNIRILPETHKFGAYYAMAEEEFSSGNGNGYIRKLGDALSACENKKNVIQFLMTL